ncbi:DUF1552 domain-containing protein [Adhaeretor mobilis]|uniref:DUF1552 domain-containing protein n=1 Tax=Adhaeretor mobilis TaxID=1930276 RepID=A0A517N2A4_9BACT|nr:DUF1552 domain-containing protein [Adhaeretor mobilis]QDT01262.1 hypothetical protein HG15A2_46040 [Adhaeretor mobilis]
MNNPPQYDQATRRSFLKGLSLRGLGTALALPFLPSTLPRNLWAATSAAKAPVRMAFMFIPNGANMAAWTPESEGADFRWSETLKPLAPLRSKVQVISGLANDAGWAHGDGAGDHARNASTFLTGMHPEKTDGKGIRVGVSVDQLAAQHFAESTRFASLELGVEKGRNTGRCDSGYSCAYSNNISWRTPNTPTMQETNPQLVFDRLFSSGKPAEQAQSRHIRQAQRRSVLDLVQEDARALQRNLSGADRHKLAEYLDGVREVETRVRSAQVLRKGDWTGDGFERPAGVPEDYAEHLRLMTDMLVLAFQTDMTRVGTLMFGRAGSNINYEPIGVRQGHHILSHHKNDAANLKQIAQINKYHVEQLAYFLKRLDSIADGAGTLLDQSLVVYGSGISDGNRHNHDDLPIVVAGGGGATDGSIVRGGTHRRFKPKTPLMNLHLSLLQKAGVPATQVADSTGALPLV